MPSRMSLFGCGDARAWRAMQGRYWEVVEARARRGNKPTKLLELDRWFQEELPVVIAARADRHVTLPELVRLMEWKLTRGKFRPRLQQLVSSNEAAEVVRCSRAAFDLLPDVAAAVTELSCLKGLGPATASAVLAAGAPGEAAFMADEAMESIPGLTPVRYTAQHYGRFLAQVTQRTHALNTVDSRPDWTPHAVEQCLWAWAVANQMKLRLLKDVDLGGDVSDSSNSDETPTKKQKTNSHTDQRPTKKKTNSDTDQRPTKKKTNSDTDQRPTKKQKTK